MLNNRYIRKRIINDKSKNNHIYNINDNAINNQINNNTNIYSIYAKYKKYYNNLNKVYKLERLQKFLYLFFFKNIQTLYYIYFIKWKLITIKNHNYNMLIKKYTLEINGIDNKILKLLNKKKDLRKKQILLKLYNKFNIYYKYILKEKIKKWAFLVRISRNKIIAKWIVKRYRISEARKKYKKLINLYRVLYYKHELQYILDKLIYYKNNLKNKSFINGYNILDKIIYFKYADFFLKQLLNVINKYFIKDKLIILRKALNKWFLNINIIKHIEKNHQKISILNKMNNKDNIINLLIGKDEEIKQLKNTLSRFPFELSKGEKLMSVIFQSGKQDFNYSVICKNTHKFTYVLDLLYNKYPGYRNIVNYCMCNGCKINEYKTLENNKIKDGDIIIVYNYE